MMIVDATLAPLMSSQLLAPVRCCRIDPLQLPAVRLKHARTLPAHNISEEFCDCLRLSFDMQRVYRQQCARSELPVVQELTISNWK